MNQFISTESPPSKRRRLQCTGDAHFTSVYTAADDMEITPEGSDQEPQPGPSRPSGPHEAALPLAGYDPGGCWPTPVDPRQAALIAAIESFSLRTGERRTRLQPWPGLCEEIKGHDNNGPVYECPSTPHRFSILCALTGHPRAQMTAEDEAETSLGSMTKRILASSFPLPLQHEGLEQNAQHAAPLVEASCASDCPPAPATSHKAKLMQAIESYLVPERPLEPRPQQSQEQLDIPGGDMEWHLRQGGLP